MKSKVQFDLNGLNEAVITAKVAYTEDVRDKVAKRFTESIGYNSILATVYFVDHGMIKDEESGKEVNASIVEIKGVGSTCSDYEVLAALMGDVQLDLLGKAIKREIGFRNRTGKGNMSYNHGQLTATTEEERVYLPEDSE